MFHRFLQVLHINKLVFATANMVVFANSSHSANRKKNK